MASARPSEFPVPDTSVDPESPPDSDVYDLGVIDLPASEDTENGFVMPYNGFVQRVGVTWPAGANNAIGVNLAVEDGLLVKSDNAGKNALTVVDSLQTFFPANHPNPEFITDDDRYVAFSPVKFIPARSRVVATIRNGSATSPLDLQVRVTTTNFDPRNAPEKLQGRPGGFR